MIHDVVSARHLGDYRIELTFDDGLKGAVDFARYIARGGVFLRFRDPDFFRSFRVNPDLGVITWDDQIDVAPEALYAEATGTPLPDWMSEQESPIPGEPAPERSLAVRDSGRKIESSSDRQPKP